MTKKTEMRVRKDLRSFLKKNYHFSAKQIMEMVNLSIQAMKKIEK
jgi:hypothetical protein